MNNLSAEKVNEKEPKFYAEHVPAWSNVEQARTWIRSDCVEVSLGPFDDPESENVLTIHLSRLPSLIAGLVAIRQRDETRTRRRK